MLYLILDVSRKKSSTTYVDTDSDDSDMEVDIAEVNLLNAVSDYQGVIKTTKPVGWQLLTRIRPNYRLRELSNISNVSVKTFYKSFIGKA